DYLADASVLPQGMPENLRAAWAAQDPAAATEWLAHHPPLKYDDDGLNSYSDGRVIAAVAASDSPRRAEALASLATLAPERLDAAWSSITSRDSSLDPQLLEAAAATGRREAYLTAALSNTRSTEVLDPSWSAIPQEARAPLIDGVLAKWADSHASPVAAKAREHWKAEVERQWAGLGD
ncbi:MAG: hypothetical protein JWO82_1826, partial [Akkermansiaceae bacterium]|nr:hypothetical protein [Akkermansiaceae bacterium]